MHIMEGFLPVEWAAFWFIISLPVLIWGFMKIRKIFSEHPEMKMTMAVSGAFIFVLSSLKMPSVTGSSSHPTGTGASHDLAWGCGDLGASGHRIALSGHSARPWWIDHPGCQCFLHGNSRSLRWLVSLQRNAEGPFGHAADRLRYCIPGRSRHLRDHGRAVGASIPDRRSVWASFTTFFEIFAVTQIPLAVAEEYFSPCSSIT